MAITVFKASSGLNINVDPVRLPFDPETGVQDLAVAYNVDHDKTGRVSRRKGYSATAVTAACHSLWSDGQDCFFVTGTSLCKLEADYSYSSLATVTTGARVSYCRIGKRVYWMNGHERGYIENATNNSWVKGTYYGPETNRQLSDPPTGTTVAAYNGRVYVAQANAVWYSDPFNPHGFDLARNFFYFGTNVKMLRPVSTGLFIGTEKSVYFYTGPAAAEMSVTKKAADPPIFGTDRELDLSIVSQEFNGMGAIWATTDGICVGTGDGIVINLTRSKVDYPTAREGAAGIVNRKYICILEP